jgi:hypothetical protein
MAAAFYSLGESGWAAQMKSNLDLSWISELLAGYGAFPWAPITAILIGVSAAFAVIYLFLLGGAIQTYSTGEPFFGGCGRNFWRLFRLTLISMLFYGLLLVINNRMRAVGQKIWGEGSEAGPLVHWNWFRTAVVLGLFGLVNLIFDYARVILVVENSRKAIRAALTATRLVAKNFGQTAGLYLMVCAIAAMLLAGYFAVSHSFAQSSMGLVLLLFLVRQAMVLAKIWSRLLFCSTAVEMYTALQPPPPPVPVVGEPEPVVSQAVQVRLAAELAVNAFEFITRWNQTPECRAVAEAGLADFGDAAGVIFDPGRLTGKSVVLNRLAEDVDAARLGLLAQTALERQCLVRIHEDIAPDGTIVLRVEAMDGGGNPVGEPPSEGSDAQL